ncbi:MAG: hypothetical protein PVG56_09785, partial [Anaerolineae bacterium]
MARNGDGVRVIVGKAQRTWEDGGPDTLFDEPRFALSCLTSLCSKRMELLLQGRGRILHEIICHQCS